MSAVSPSIYEVIALNKGDQSVYIDTKTVLVDYYESLFSPTVTANIAIVDTEGLTSQFPIEGNESISFSIRSKLATIDYSDNPLYLNTAPTAAKEANREAIAFSLVSKHALDNLKTTISTKYKGKISDSVKKILAKELNIPTNKIFVDPTQNVYNFLGSSREAFDIILGLCNKSVPAGADGVAGYFFYETQRGVHFQSISKLIEQEPYPYTYTYNSITKFDENNDFKILSYRPVRNQTILNSLKSGVFSTRNIFFDPRTLTYKELIFKINENGDLVLGDKKPKKLNYLGAKPKISADLVENFTRTHFHILDVGMLEAQSTDTNNNPEEWQAVSTARCNILFNKIVDIVIPCNPNLVAGSTINIQIQEASESPTKKYNENESGKYLILHLCHHFEPTKSYTSLTLVKDTPGS